MAVPNTLKFHYVKACRMNKLSLLERSDGDFNVANIYPTPETDNDSGINHINGDEIDICVDDEKCFSLLVHG